MESGSGSDHIVRYRRDSELAKLLMEDDPTPLISNPDLSYELQQIASNLSSQSSIPYKGLRNLWSAYPSASRPKLLHLFSGSDFVLTSPKQREKSDELKERLRKLADLAERNAYKELVRDITPMRRTPEDSFSSYKDQIGFGLHVVVTMFTGFLVGYAAFRALFNHNPVMSAAGGILGLLKAFILSQPEAYEIKIGDLVFRRPGDPPLEQVVEMLHKQEGRADGFHSSEEQETSKDEL